MKKLTKDSMENITKERDGGQIYYKSSSSKELRKYLDENPNFLSDNNIKYRENTLWVGSIDLNRFNEDGSPISKDVLAEEEKNPNYTGYNCLKVLEEKNLIRVKIITYKDYVEKVKTIDEYKDNWGHASHNVISYLGSIYKCHVGPTPGKSHAEGGKQFEFLTGEDDNMELYDYIGSLNEFQKSIYDEMLDPNIVPESPEHRRRLYEMNFTDESESGKFYHATKAHWLLHSILEEGAHGPLSVEVSLKKYDAWSMCIHPGSVRAVMVREAELFDFPIILSDPENIFSEFPYANVQDIIKLLKDMEKNRTDKVENKPVNASFLMVGDRLETNIAEPVPELYFRRRIYKWSQDMHNLFAGKNLKMYIGYDNNHCDVHGNNLSDVSETALELLFAKEYTSPNFEPNTVYKSLPHHKRAKIVHDFFDPIEIKKLDINKIDCYTRPYANQSTQFTYSRFLIPYLENFEGFSIFVDDDFLFVNNPLKMFYWVNPKNAVTCIKYPNIMFDETKFDGQKNVNYPKKLWSSLMIFNNSHPDCKKLTPEIVNTMSGSWLHQFEWTDAIGSLPRSYVYTEGYDEDLSSDALAIHYTRGGPWIKGMDTSSIKKLEWYEKVCSIIQEDDV